MIIRVDTTKAHISDIAKAGCIQWIDTNYILVIDHFKLKEYDVSILYYEREQIAYLCRGVITIGKIIW